MLMEGRIVVASDTDIVPWQYLQIFGDLEEEGFRSAVHDEEGKIAKFFELSRDCRSEMLEDSVLKSRTPVSTGAS